MKNTLYSTWSGMMKRCYDPKHVSYRWYGAKGIKVSTEWHSYRVFALDMGVRPEGKTLDRKDPTASYSKSNCRWATPLEQAANKIEPKEITEFSFVD